MGKLSIIFICVFFYINVFAQTTNKNIYSGGMLVFQPGITIANNNYQNINNLSFGIGGILRLYFYNHLTVGIYGGSNKTNYSSKNSQNSYINLGYGGLFAGYTHNQNKLRYTISGFVGGGSVKNLHIEMQTQNVLNQAYLYKYPAMVISPIISVDYKITPRIWATIQTVYLIAYYNNNTLYNPIMQFGILFNR